MFLFNQSNKISSEALRPHDKKRSEKSLKNYTFIIFVDLSLILI